jgi:hypothetical protein
VIKILFWDGQERRRYADDGAVVDTVGIDRLARHSPDGEARSCCVSAEISASAASGLVPHIANRLGSRMAQELKGRP